MNAGTSGVIQICDQCCPIVYSSVDRKLGFWWVNWNVIILWLEFKKPNGSGQTHSLLVMFTHYYILVDQILVMRILDDFNKQKSYCFLEGSW